MSTPGGVQYSGGHHEYGGEYHDDCGGYHEYSGAVGVQYTDEYTGRYHDECGGYHEYAGRCSVHCGFHTHSIVFPITFPTFIMISPSVLNTPQCTHDIPQCTHDIPQCTAHSPVYCTDIMQGDYSQKCILCISVA